MSEPKPDSAYTLRYPRRRIARAVLRGVGRALLPILTRTTASGLDHFPERGPLIVVGNHIAAMEVVLMVVYAPWQMELLGPGDIAPPPALNAIAEFHGFIPINRGNLDRQALTQALDVLRQGGILGMFPEGGIWDPGAMEAKRGVAWLSALADAPILPIGFGGLEGALDAALKLKRPRLVMNVGSVIPPVVPNPDLPRRDALRHAAMAIMEAVENLIPPAYRAKQPELLDERFSLSIEARDPKGNGVPLPATLQIVQTDALCKFFYRPAILRIFVKDLHLPATPLQRLDQAPPQSLLSALDAILHYVEAENPGFFTYRFGSREGVAMEAALRELRALAAWADQTGLNLHICPTRRYRLAGTDEEIIELSPGQSLVW
ncbi:MAG: 1-acyl-sn-glycerol-3-phosphate acyltransferase [Anaerolineae bacterium]|nr:1-acyl-sn-glycerol-3-phosphate acyltransferase [Anaerolineae bacterium]